MNLRDGCVDKRLYAGVLQTVNMIQLLVISLSFGYILVFFFPREIKEIKRSSEILETVDT